MKISGVDPCHAIFGVFRQIASLQHLCASDFLPKKQKEDMPWHETVFRATANKKVGRALPAMPSNRKASHATVKATHGYAVLEPSCEEQPCIKWICSIPLRHQFELVAVCRSNLWVNFQLFCLDSFACPSELVMNDSFD